LANRVDRDNSWLGLVLAGPAGHAFAIGARVALVAGGRRQVREVRRVGRVLSQGDLRLLFGLGPHHGSVELLIRWPDGRHQRESTRDLGRYWQIVYRPNLPESAASKP
jgi:hypothetical protein